MDYAIQTFYDRNNYLTMFLLKYRGYEIAIHVFYKRGTFLWIGSLAVFNSKIRWFNDVPRGIQMLTLTTIYDSMFNEIKVMENIEKFMFDYEHSKFIECNNEMAKNITLMETGKYEQNKELNSKVFPCMIELVESIESLYKRYWLTSGALLGWYRQCGVIAHTTNMDFIMPIEDYDEDLKDNFRFLNKNLYFWLQLGRKQSSLQFRLGGCAFNYDIFFLYELSPIRYCNYYHLDYIIP